LATHHEVGEGNTVSLMSDDVIMGEFLGALVNHLPRINGRRGCAV